MSTYLAHAIILNKDNYKDYDSKFIIYTLGYGKISALGKGTKKITSKLNSHLEFFSVVKVMIARSAAINRLAGAQLVKKYKNISQVTSKTIIALYFLEVVSVLVKYDFEDDAIFAIMIKFLALLDQSQAKKDDLSILYKSLFAILEHLGYKPRIKFHQETDLTAQLNRLITDIAEREIKSYRLLSQLLS